MSNAERQQRYRDRKRQRNAAVTAAICAIEDVMRDFWKDGDQFIYLGNWGFGPQYARVVVTGSCHSTSAPQRIAPR